MIIEVLVVLIYSVMSVLTLTLKVPGMPQEVIDTVGILFDYMSDGLAILSNYVNLPYLLVLFSIVAIFDACIFVYHLIMWVLKKIPLLGIE